MQELIPYAFFIIYYGMFLYLFATVIPKDRAVEFFQDENGKLSFSRLTSASTYMLGITLVMYGLVSNTNMDLNFILTTFGIGGLSQGGEKLRQAIKGKKNDRRLEENN